MKERETEVGRGAAVRGRSVSKQKEKQANKTKPERASTEIQEGNEEGERPRG